MTSVKRIRWKLITLAILVALSGFIVFSCDWHKIEDPLTAPTFNVSETSSLFATLGLERSTFYTYESIFLSLEDLIPSRQTDIQVIRLADDKVIYRLIVISDEQGRLMNIPIWHHVGTDLGGNLVDESGNYIVHVLQPQESKPWTNIVIPFNVVNGVVPAAQIRATNADGIFSGETALVGESIYAAGSGFTAGVEVRLTVAANSDLYNPGDVLTDETPAVESVVVQADGSIPNTEVWPSVPTTGSYDIIADLAPFGEYNVGDVVSHGLVPGLVIQQPDAGADIIADIACDIMGNYQNTFAPSDAIFARVNPLQLPKKLSELASVYVLPHKDLWIAGESLVTVRTVGTMQMPTHCLVNPRSASLCLTGVRGVTDPNIEEPEKLWPGNYDVIVDLDRNGVYDPGTDILDGGSQVGFTVSGTVPEVKFICTADIDFLGRMSDETKIWGKLVWADGTPIVGATVYYTIRKGPGTISHKRMKTDENGLSYTIFTGAEYGKVTVIRVFVRINGAKYIRLSHKSEMSLNFLPNSLRIASFIELPIQLTTENVFTFFKHVIPLQRLSSQIDNIYLTH